MNVSDNKHLRVWLAGAIFFTLTITGFKEGQDLWLPNHEHVHQKPYDYIAPRGLNQGITLSTTADLDLDLYKVFSNSPILL